MAFTNAARHAALDAIGAAADRVSMHTGDPGSTGTAEVTGGSYARAQTTWAAASAGSKTGSQVTLNIPAGTTITHWGLWSSGGVFHYGGALSAAEAYGSAGTFQFTPTLSAG